MLHSRSRPKRSESGQAMVEYQVLIPGSILLVVAAAWLLGPAIGNSFR
jgi:Flp pilus assembly pilin Flp